MFGALADALPPLVAEAGRRWPGAVEPAVDAQRTAVEHVLRRVGVDATAGASTSPRTPSASLGPATAA